MVGVLHDNAEDESPGRRTGMTIPMLSYGALLAMKYASRALYDLRVSWVGDVPADPWDDVRLIAVLHHTSLAEGVYLAAVPNHVLRRMSRHGVVPVASETMKRPIEGRIFRLMAPHAVPITRRKDDTWERVMAQVDDPQAMVTLFPEGRMMRPDGCDKNGAPMNIRPGVADVISALGTGRMILAYSGGLHHVFPPNASRPRVFQPITVKLESLDIASYVAARRAEAMSFRAAVVRDLTLRRDLHTPIAPGTPPAVGSEVIRRRQGVLSRRTDGGRRERTRRSAGSTSRAARSSPPGPAA